MPGLSALPVLDAAAIARLAPLPDVVAALAAAYGAPGGPPSQPPRLGIPMASAGAGLGGDLLVMPAVAGGAAGVKVVTVLPANPAAGRPAIQGAYLLLDAATGAPVAVLDGAALTAVRTPAASALATRALARPESARLAVFGTGPQALGHVAAMRLVLPGLERVQVVGRDPARAADAVARLRAAGHPAEAASAAAAAGADVVCTCTSSATAVLDEADVRAGAHVNAVGSYAPDRRELGERLVARARVVVDDPAAARAEAGDLVLAAAAGAFDWAGLAGDLGGVARGEVRRHSAQEVTVFKSVGLPLQDLVVAVLAARRAGLLPPEQP